MHELRIITGVALIGSAVFGLVFSLVPNLVPNREMGALGGAALCVIVYLTIRKVTK